MKRDIKNAHTRESILGLLTDAEIAKISRAEDQPKLIEGDEYVDLEALDSGVQQVQAVPRDSPHHVLPRSAVSYETWDKILRALTGKS